MRIECNNNCVKELQFDERYCEIGKNPQPWQFKEVYDASTSGLEIIWNYETTTINKKDKNKQNIPYKLLSKDFFSITFPSHIRVKGNYKFLILPHHSSFFAMSNWSKHQNPVAIPQIIEFDWWPGQLEIIFVRKKTIFEKGRPIAQAMVIPNEELELNKMNLKTTEKIRQNYKEIQKNKEKYITRKEKVKNFNYQDNLYARLSHIKNNKPKKRNPNSPKLSLRWKLK